MGLKVAFQMDPIAGVDIDADSTFRLAEEAQARGHALFVYGPDRLALDGGRITARGHPVTVRRMRGDHVTFGAAERIDLASRDVVWLRQDPPFDMAYITAPIFSNIFTLKPLVVNDPVSVRNAPEKLFVTHFDGVMPPTLISSSDEESQGLPAT